jgi:LysM repeat protein
MRRLSVYQTLFLLCIGFMLLLAWMPAQAQTTNLLTNPGFEPPFSTVDGDPPREVAQGWVPWHVPAPAGSPSFFNRQPEYYPTAPDTARIRSGSDAQQVLSFFAVHTGGVFQRVTGITPGATLKFSVYAYIWSTTFDEPDQSEEDGDVIVDVGIDPTGGTDGESQNIVWSSSVEAEDSYDAYKQYTVEAAAQGSAVTVFIRTQAGVPVKHNNIYLDDASLAAGGEGSAPTATGTSAPTQQPSNTPVPPTSTPVPPTNTPQPPTSTLTNTPRPTVGIVATSTPAEQPLPATETPTNTPEPTSTFTSEPTLTSTVLPSDVPSATNTSEPPTSTFAPSSPTPLVEEATPTTEAGVTSTPTPTSESKPISEEFPGTIIHTVRRGDNVDRLATLYNSTIDAISAANGLDDNYLIHVGQELIIPVRIVVLGTPTGTPQVIVVTATPSGPVPPIGSGNIYTVQFGDTLSRIARLFNTTVETIAQMNGIVNPNQIQVGQQLNIPGPPPAPEPAPTEVPPVVETQTYVVQPGDTLNRIAIRFGVSIGALVQANNIRQPNLIYWGQLLVIP